MPGIDDILSAPVDFDRLVRKLDFAEEDLAKATLEQASLFLQASRFRVAVMRKRIQAEAAYESAKATLALKIRKKKATDKGITEAYIKDRLTASPSVRATKKQCDRLVPLEEWSRLLVEAYRMRRDACRVIAGILGSEAAADLRIKEGEGQMARVKKKVRRMYPGGVGEDG